MNNHNGPKSNRIPSVGTNCQRNADGPHVRRVLAIFDLGPGGGNDAQKAMTWPRWSQFPAQTMIA